MELLLIYHYYRDCLTLYSVCYFVFLPTCANFVIGLWTDKFARI
jgi:hypothetical protein